MEPVVFVVTGLVGPNAGFGRYEVCQRWQRDQVVHSIDLDECSATFLS